MIKSGLEDIGKNYFRKDNVSELLSLKDIQCFKQFFCHYLQNTIHVSDNDLDESFKRWCDQLSKNRAFPEVRKIAVYALWFRCDLKQYHIAQLLGASTRTIRRDLRELEKQMFH